MIISAGVTAAIITAAAASGTAVATSEISRRSAKKASSLQDQSAQEALDWEKQLEERRRGEYDEERAHNWAKEDRDRADLLEDRAADRAVEAANTARKVSSAAPFLNLGTSSANNLAGLLTVGGDGSGYAVEGRPQPYQGTNVPPAGLLPPPARPNLRSLMRA